MVGEFAGAGEFEQFPGSPEHETVPGTEFGTDGAPSQETQPEATPEQWKQAYDNRQSWERSLKQKDQKYASVRRVLETAFGRGIDQWNQVDMSDLQAFAMINQRVRSDPEFAKRWHKSLTETFQESGETKAEAQQHATQVVQAVKDGQQPAQPQQAPQPQQPQIPKEILDRLNRMEQIAVQQEMTRLEGNLWDELGSQIGVVAPDLTEYGPLIEEQALHSLFFHSDTELMQRAQDGTLPQLVGHYVKQASDRIRGLNQQHLSKQAEARSKKSATAPTPFGAAAQTPAGPSPETLSVEQMGQRLKRAMAEAEG